MENEQFIERIVPDTSIIIEGLLSDKIQKNEIKTKEVVIHEAVLAELEHQANEGKAIGFLGLDEIKRIKGLSAEKKFELSFKGVRPRAAEIRHASLGEIDSLIRQLAFDEDATLITSDKVQSEVGLARGMKIFYFKKPEAAIKKLKLEKFFDELTMSVHLRENVTPIAKRGMPGKWEFITLRKKVLSQDEIQEISREIIEDTKLRKDGFIEIERMGSTIVQLGKYRIVITRPPFSDGWEITAVRPVKRLSLEDYKLSEKLMKRIAEQAEGVLVAGSPGMGKCLPHEEIIYTKNMTPIKVGKLFNSNGDVIYSIDNEGRFTEDKIISRHKRKANKICSIETRIGRKIKTTPEHPLLVFDSFKIFWKDAKDVKSGEHIAILKKTRIGEDDRLNVMEFYDPKKTLCFISAINKKIPIYYKFFGTERKLLELAYLKDNYTVKEACIFCNRSKSVIRNTIKNLIDKKVLHKERSKYRIKSKEFNLRDCSFLLLDDIRQLDIDEKKIEKIAFVDNNSSKLTFVSLPRKVTPSLCRFLGYIYSEGSSEKLSFTNKNAVLVKDFKDCARKVFGITEWKKYKITHYIDWNVVLRPLLTNFGYPIKKTKKSRTTKLPEFLFRCSLHNLKNFLQAYFDGDGGVNKKSRVIEFYTSSNIAAKQLTLLLMRFGIISHIKEKFQKGANRYTVRIFDTQSIDKFSKLCSDKTEKFNDVLYCKKKRYSQTLVYNLKSLLKNLYKDTKIKLKESVSIDRGFEILQNLYKKYYDFSSRNENILIILREYIDRLKYINEEFNKNKHKLSYKKLRENKMDHNCLRHWKGGRKIKISTLNKISNIVGCGINVSPKEISKTILESINQQRLSISFVANESSVRATTLQFRISKGWNINIEELESICETLHSQFMDKKKQIEYSIKVLQILFNSDIIFDCVVKKEEIEGPYDVYDFETKSHNFIVGELPLVVHNSTYAQALAEFYSSKEKIVKTVEAPRDLVLPETVTQYAISHGDAQEIHDILLLSRPDYTIFDEMRNTDDFKLFADLRLAGVGMVGVVHATNPIDAIQRFIGRVEMGVIPQVIDTVVFIKNGFIDKVLSLKMTVKVPSGMTEADLARPVVVVNDFETGKLEYEIYSYGEQTVVIPVQEEGPKVATHRLASDSIKRFFEHYSRNIDVEVIADNKCIVYVPSNDIAKIIGKQGKNIEKIEKELGMGIDIRELGGEKSKETKQKEVPYETNMKKNSIIFDLGINMQHKDINVYIGDEFIMTAKAGKTGLIKVKKNNNVGRLILKAMNSGEKVRLLV